MNYLVHIKIYTGGYEKTTCTLITDATDKNTAGRVAMILECHNEPVISNNGQRVEDGFEFIYEINDIQIVENRDIQLLNTLGIHPYSTDMLDPRHYMKY